VSGLAGYTPETLKQSEEASPRESLVLNPYRIANLNHGVSAVVGLVRVRMASVGNRHPPANKVLFGRRRYRNVSAEGRADQLGAIQRTLDGRSAPGDSKQPNPYGQLRQHLDPHCPLRR